jgi:hypothetical protein
MYIFKSLRKKTNAILKLNIFLYKNAKSSEIDSMLVHVITLTGQEIGPFLSTSKSVFTFKRLGYL